MKSKSARRAEAHARYDGPLSKEAREYIAGREEGPLMYWPTLAQIKANDWGNLDPEDLWYQFDASPQAAAILGNPNCPWYEDVRDYRRGLAELAHQARACGSRPRVPVEFDPLISVGLPPLGPSPGVVAWGVAVGLAAIFVLIWVLP